jgi:hypothetical protein
LSGACCSFPQFSTSSPVESRDRATLVPGTQSLTYAYHPPRGLLLLIQNPTVQPFSLPLHNGRNVYGVCVRVCVKTDVGSLSDSPYFEQKTSLFCPLKKSCTTRVTNIQYIFLSLSCRCIVNIHIVGILPLAVGLFTLCQSSLGRLCASLYCSSLR